MKMIHCADLHLDSKMDTNLDKERAKERKAELLHTFERMIAYAVQNHIEAILIAGDLFDTTHISATVRNTLLMCITGHPAIRFYYLKGNHDKNNFLSGLEEIPANLKMFDEQWQSYEEADGRIVISGIELNGKNSGNFINSLVLDSKKFNIVMLHGQEVENTVKNKAEAINLKQMKNKGIDYLALGHIHGYKKEQLDARGIYCYPGCLEGRGFDECGEHGFVVIDINEVTGAYTHQFIPFAYRRLYTVNVDVSGCQSTSEMVVRATVALQEAGCDETSLVKIVLQGMLDVECEKDLEYFLARFKIRFYFVKVYDETTLKIEIEDYLLDESLKGEFVRLVMEDKSMGEEEKKLVIRYGLQAIAGEEIQ